MNKKLVAILCVVALTMSVPVLALGAPSPSNEGQATSNGVVINVDAASGSNITVIGTTTQAANVQLGTSEEVLASFEVTGEASDITITFNVGTQYAGYAYTIFIEHNDGTTEVREGTIAADGTITIHVDALSYFTVVVDKSSAPASGTSTDTTATSPKTGVETGMVLGISVAMLFAAGAVAFSLRKKVAK